MARIGAARMAQNTNRMELIFLFEKMYFDIISGIKCKKT